MSNSSVLDTLSAEDMEVLKEIIGSLTEEGAKPIYEAVREDPKNLQIIIDSYKKKKEAAAKGDFKAIEDILEEEAQMLAESV